MEIATHLRLVDPHRRAIIIFPLRTDLSSTWRHQWRPDSMVAYVQKRELVAMSLELAWLSRKPRTQRSPAVAVIMQR